MKSETMKKVLAGVKVAAVAATISVMAAGCCHHCKKGSCGGGSCGGDKGNCPKTTGEKSGSSCSK
jgi:hypothetical protein